MDVFLTKKSDMDAKNPIFFDEIIFHFSSLSWPDPLGPLATLPKSFLGYSIDLVMGADIDQDNFLVGND